MEKHLYSLVETNGNCVIAELPVMLITRQSDALGICSYLLDQGTLMPKVDLLSSRIDAQGLNVPAM